jgi:hypothetical protein
MKALLAMANIFTQLGALVLLATAAPGLAQDGFFHVENRNGIWWFVDPRVALTLSQGVDIVSYYSVSYQIKGTGACPYGETISKLYPDHNAWALASLARIWQWGFNTIGGHSAPEVWTHGVPFTVSLDIGADPLHDWQYGDYFAPTFEENAKDIAGKVCRPRSLDYILVGYFSDNELRWGSDWRGKETMLELYLKLPPDAPGRARAGQYLRERYGNDIGRLNQAWGMKAASFDEPPAPGATEAFLADAAQFLEIVATRYFRICAEAIHAADPNHLYLGARFAGVPPEPVLRAARGVDVLSIDPYEFDPRSSIDGVFKASGRPVLVSEFWFRAEDCG